ncbi:MAG: hypothetical protein IJL17_15365, partial [Kiritimatiellae bacterium]|nr:hypothetical protein [Kiritimatiellia bacterium]
NSLHLSFLSCLAAETERICKSAPEIKGLGDARLWFQALLLTNNREEPPFSYFGFLEKAVRPTNMARRLRVSTLSYSELRERCVRFW